MSPIKLTMIFNLLQAAPTIAGDLKKAIDAAESPEAIDAKIKEVLTDLEDVIKSVVDTL